MILVLTMVFFSRCNNERSESSSISGAALAQQICANCHSYPDPSLLDKATWKNYVLPRMGYQLGFYDNALQRDSLIESGAAEPFVLAKDIYPEKASLNKEQWESIVSFYLSKAPEKLPYPVLPKMESIEPDFKIISPQLSLSPPSTTFLAIPQEGGILLGDANTKRLYSLNKELKVINAANVREGLVGIEKSNDVLLCTVMGSFSPTDAPSGFLMALKTDGKTRPKILIPNLQRPVHTASGDLDGDGQIDFVVCEFAKWTGGLNWWKLEQGQYQKNILRDRPGAISTALVDIDQDKDLDILALFGQGDEGIFLYENDGQGNFSEKRILDFPSSYGSSSMTVLDWNKDGAWDILYTCGDNADYPPVVKPYHGIRLFMNNGANVWKESFFLAMPGAYAAKPEDFDGDGDLDIASISFFPDYDRAPRSFILWVQEGDGDFKAKTFADQTKGRWIVMDTGDYDGDGDKDIALGSLTLEAPGHLDLVERWVNEKIPFVVLENQKAP